MLGLFKKKTENLTGIQPLPTMGFPDPPKPWMESSTVRASFVTIGCGFILAIIPSVANIASRMAPQQKDNIADIAKILHETASVITVLAGGTAISGRIDAHQRIYTPKGLPGPNKEELY